MFARFRKTDYWKSVGDVAGFLGAVDKLGPKYRQLDGDKQGYVQANCIWGQLAELTEIPNKNTYETRKWLYNAWKEDRRKVWSTFYANKTPGQLPQATIETLPDLKIDSESANSQVGSRAYSSSLYQSYTHHNRQV